MDLITLPTNSIKPNGYNFNELSDGGKSLNAEVKSRGFLMHHIVVRKEGEEHIIVDGEHQWKAAIAAGFENVPVQVVDVTAAQAIAESYRRNGLRGEANRVKLGQALRSMQEQSPDAEGKPLSLKKTAAAVGKSDVWVKTTLQYALLADMAEGRQGFPSVQDIAKLTEADMKSWLAFAEGTGPNPDPAVLTLDGEAGAEPVKDKEVLSDEEKIRKTIEGIVLKLNKLSASDRAQVAKAIKRLDKQDAQEAAQKETAEPGLYL